MVYRMVRGWLVINGGYAGDQGWVGWCVGVLVGWYAGDQQWGC